MLSPFVKQSEQAKGQRMTRAAFIYPLSIRWGIVGTSAAVLLSLIVSTAAYSLTVVKVTECGARNFGRLIALPLISTVIMVSLVFGLKSTFNTIGIGQFILLVAAGVLVYAGITYLLDRFFNYGISRLVKESLTSLKGS